MTMIILQFVTDTHTIIVITPRIK